MPKKESTLSWKNAILTGKDVKGCAMRVLAYSFVILLYSLSASYAGEMVDLRPYARQLSFTGFTRAIQKMTVTGEVSGRYTAVHVDIGDTIEEEVVAEIDPTFVRLDLEKNRIGQRKTVRRLQLEKKTLQRYTNLIKKNSTARATYDKALLNSEILKLSLQELQAEEDRLDEMLKRHTLRAPKGWRVIERFVEPGEYVRQGEPVLQLGNFTRMSVAFQLTYEQLELLRNQEDLRLFLADLQQQVKASILRISPDFDARKKKIAVELMVRGNDLQESAGRSGLRALLTLQGKEEAGTFLVPRSAIAGDYDTHWLIDGEGKQHRIIRLGTTASGSEAIVTGNSLSVGQQVRRIAELLN